MYNTKCQQEYYNYKVSRWQVLDIKSLIRISKTV